MTRATLIAFLLTLTQVCPGCATPDSDGGFTTVILPYSGGDWFRLRVCDGEVTTSDEGERICDVVFDTRCIELNKQTFSLTNLPTGENRTVLFESYTAADCSADAEVAVGLRGGVVITDEQPAPYYYIPVYETGAVTPLPEKINVSISSSKKVDFCETAEECHKHTGENSGCFRLLGEDHYDFVCVPTCVEDVDCEHLHPQATCDPNGIVDTDDSGVITVLAGLCVMHHPYPLNMSSPRAFGAALQGPDGSVLLVGGFDRGLEDPGGSQLRLMGARRSLERYDGNTGIFATSGLSGPSPVARGFFGVGRLASGRYAVAGGSQSALITEDGNLEVEKLAGKICAAGVDECSENNLSAAVDLIDMVDGTITTATLPEAVVAPGIVAVDEQSFVVLGGWVNQDGDINKPAVPSDRIGYCTLDEGTLTCVPMGEPLSSTRVAPAATCLDLDEDTGECGLALVVGGSEQGTDADLLTFSGGAAVIVSTLSTSGLPADMMWVSFCGDLLVADGSVYTLEVDLGANLVTATPVVTDLVLEGSLHRSATAAIDGGGCWLAGGWDPGTNTARADIVKVGSEGLAPMTYALSSDRYGASAAVINGGPLKGSVLVTGGLVPEGPAFVNGAEVLNP